MLLGYGISNQSVSTKLSMQNEHLWASAFLGDEKSRGDFGMGRACRLLLSELHLWITQTRVVVAALAWNLRYEMRRSHSGPPSNYGCFAGVSTTQVRTKGTKKVRIACWKIILGQWHSSCSRFFLFVKYCHCTCGSPYYCWCFKSVTQMGMPAVKR